MGGGRAKRGPLFVAVIIVQDDVDEFAGRHGGLDGVEETDELTVSDVSTCGTD